MAFTAPDITIFTIDNTYAGLCEGLYNHWAPGGASTKFTASDPTGTPTGSASFSLLPDDVGETWQMNVRSHYWAIDPGAQITTSAAPGSTASAAWSGELSIMLAGASGNGKVTVIEFPDAIYVFTSRTDGSSWAYGAHIGRILTPFWASDIANGLSGLGLLGRYPFSKNGIGGEGAWFNSATGQYGPDYQKIQAGNTKNEWDLPIQSFQNSSAGYHIEWDSGITEAEATLGTSTSAVPLILMQNSGGIGPCGDRPLGVLKYIYSWWEAHTPKTRITDGSGRHLIHLWNSNAATRLLIPWDASTIP